MAGHSQFKNIMHRKGRQDAQKSKVFGFLNQHFRGRGTGEATVYYQLNAADLNHADRVRAIGPAYAAAGVPDSAGIALR